jgi:hypothetical protein
MSRIGARLDLGQPEDVGAIIDHGPRGSRAESVAPMLVGDSIAQIRCPLARIDLQDDLTKPTRPAD